MSGEELTGEELAQDPPEVAGRRVPGPDEAREDPSVDDEEAEEPRHTDLPEGARAEDYEQQDGGEETPAAERGQRRG
jgi:hypothetical protein